MAQCLGFAFKTAKKISKKGSREVRSGKILITAVRLVGVWAYSAYLIFCVHSKILKTFGNLSVNDSGKEGPHRKK